MPKKSVYIRDEDLAAWESLPSKTSFVAAALASQVAGEPLLQVGVPVRGPTLPVEVAADIRPRFSNLSGGDGPDLPSASLRPLKEIRGAIKTCRHGYPPEFCKHAKIKNGKKVC